VRIYKKRSVPVRFLQRLFSMIALLFSSEEFAAAGVCVRGEFQRDGVVTYKLHIDAELIYVYLLLSTRTCSIS